MNAAATNGWVIDLQHVSKTYKGGVQALRGVDMRVKAGEVFGLLGPNGAGKSTLVKILTTVISPTRAEGTMLGMPVGHKPTLARVGYLPEHHRFPEYLTGAQVLDFYGAMQGVPGAVRKERRGRLLDLVGMTNWGSTAVKGYSKGMRQRIGIAQALMSDPDLVILDEPTDGVDPVGRRDIRQMLRAIRDTGKTVFLNSHLLSELEMLCDRVAIMVQGQVVQQGTIHELTSDAARYEIELASGVNPDQVLQALEPLRHVRWHDESIPPGTPNGANAGGTLNVRLKAASLWFMTTEAEALQPCIDALRSRGLVIRSIRVHKPTLEDLFMQAVTDPTTGQAMAPGAVLNTPGARRGAPMVTGS